MGKKWLNIVLEGGGPRPQCNIGWVHSFRSNKKKQIFHNSTIHLFIHSFILWRLIPPPGQVRMCPLFIYTKERRSQATNTSSKPFGDKRDMFLRIFLYSHNKYNEQRLALWVKTIVLEIQDDVGGASQSKHHSRKAKQNSSWGTLGRKMVVWKERVTH